MNRHESLGVHVSSKITANVGQIIIAVLTASIISANLPMESLIMEGEEQVVCFIGLFKREFY